MAKKNLTELVFILDKSGSMCGLEADTVGGYNTVLEQNRQVEGEAIVSAVLFDNYSHVVRDRVDIGHVKPMSCADFKPSGCTALLDAVGGAIKYHATVQHILPKHERAEHVIFAIMTDGYENASRHYTYPEVKGLIEKYRKKGWEFIFLGAGIDVAAEAGRLGVAADRAVSYEASSMGVAAAYDEMAARQCAIRAGFE